MMTLKHQLAYKARPLAARASSRIPTVRMEAGSRADGDCDFHVGLGAGLRLGPAVEAGGGGAEAVGNGGEFQPRLNVHAKEFTMVGGHQGNHHQGHLRSAPTRPTPLQQSFSIGSMLPSVCVILLIL